MSLGNIQKDSKIFLCKNIIIIIAMYIVRRLLKTKCLSRGHRFPRYLKFGLSEMKNVYFFSNLEERNSRLTTLHIFNITIFKMAEL